MPLRRPDPLQRLVRQQSRNSPPSDPSKPYLRPSADKGISDINRADPKIGDLECVDVEEPVRPKDVSSNPHDAAIAEAHDVGRVLIQAIDQIRGVEDKQFICSASERQDLAISSEDFVHRFHCTSAKNQCVAAQPGAVGLAQSSAFVNANGFHRYWSPGSRLRATVDLHVKALKVSRIDGMYHLNVFLAVGFEDFHVCRTPCRSVLQRAVMRAP